MKIHNKFLGWLTLPSTPQLNYQPTDLLLFVNIVKDLPVWTIPVLQLRIIH
jgi:hypothetical protein